MKKRLFKSGNYTLAIRLPKKILTSIKMKEGDEFKIELIDNKIVLKPINTEVNIK